MFTCLWSSDCIVSNLFSDRDHFSKPSPNRGVTMSRLPFSLSSLLLRVAYVHLLLSGMFLSALLATLNNLQFAEGCADVNSCRMLLDYSAFSCVILCRF